MQEAPANGPFRRDNLFGQLGVLLASAQHGGGFDRGHALRMMEQGFPSAVDPCR